MNKSSINLHFSQHGILHTMERKTLLVFLDHFSGLFEDRGITLPSVDDTGAQIPMEELRKVLIDLPQEETMALQLGETLEDIILLHENFELCRVDIEAVASRFDKELDELLPESDSDLTQAVALCLVDEAREQLARLSARSTKMFKEFPWDAGEEADNDAEGCEDIACVRDMAEIRSRIDKAQKDINNGFKSKSYQSRCHIYAYEIPADDEVWFIVEHGGRKLTVEDFSPESGQVSTVKYHPLSRNVVVASFRYKMLRIKADAEWQTGLYLSVFGTLLAGDGKGSFVDRPRYTFDPVAARNMARAFARDEFSEMIASVVVKGITVRLLHDGIQPVYVKYSSYDDLCSMWDSMQGCHGGQIEQIRLELRVYHPLTGKQEPVSVSFSRQGKLRVGKSQYTIMVREWLRSRGFEEGYKEPELPECADTKAAAGDTDTSVFWEQVRLAWRMARASKNTLHGMFSKSAASFLCGFLVHTNDPATAQEWYDLQGKRWDVCKIGDKYFRYEKESEEPTDRHGRIDPRELEVMELDKRKLVAAVQRVLFDGSGNVQTIAEGNACNTGIYKLGEQYGKRVLCYAYVPGERSDAGYTRVIGHNAEDAKVQGRLVFFSFAEEAPTANEKEVDAGTIQHIFIGDMMEYDSTQNQLVARLDCWRLVAAPKFPDDPDGYYSRWPLAYPPMPSFHHIDITLNQFDCYIKVGEHGKSFEYSKISLFSQNDHKHEGESANLQHLRTLIALNERMAEGWSMEQTSIPASSRNALSVALCRFFGIQEQFYEATRATAKKRSKLYKLTFGHCENNRDS